LRLGGKRGSEQKSWAQRVHLMAKLRQHRRKVFRVFRLSGTTAADNGIFPVDINTVENSWGLDAGGEVASDKSIDAGADKIAHVFRLRGAGKTAGLVPSSKGDENFQFGKATLEFLKLMKGPAKLIWPRWIGAAMDTVSGGIGMVQSCLAVSNLALILCHAPESVIQLRETACSPAAGHVLQREISRLCAPFSEISDDLELPVWTSCFLSHSGGGHAQCKSRD